MRIETGRVCATCRKRLAVGILQCPVCHAKTERLSAPAKKPTTRQLAEYLLWLQEQRGKDEKL